MPKDIFQFHKFTIKQDRCAMKVGTDGVLLGCWASLRAHAHLLDIGTGTGLIALMAAQRGAGKVDAVEIVPEAAQQAYENFANSPWGNIIEVHTCDIRKYYPDCQYDFIWSNPPYYDNPLLPPDKARSIARNSRTLPTEQLAQCVSRLLSAEGIFAVILPEESAENMETSLAGHGLFLSRKTLVQSRPYKPVRRILMEFSQKVTRTVETTLVLSEEQGERTDEYKMLTKDFYLTY